MGGRICPDPSGDGVAEKDGCAEGCDGAFAFCAGDVDCLQRGEVRRGVACAFEPVEHFWDCLGVEVWFWPIGRGGCGCEEGGDGEVGLKGVEKAQGLRVCSRHG